MTYHDTNRLLRDRLLSNTALSQALAQFRSKGAAFFPGSGNLGDALIQLGTYDYFQEIGWSPDIISGMTPLALRGRDAVVLGGGGGWIEGHYKYYPEILTPFLERGGELLILPSTFWGYQSFLRRYASQLTVFVREEASLRELSGVEELRGRLHLADDMAFATNPTRFSVRGTPSFPLIKLLRRDGETKSADTPMESIDLPIAFNNTQWSSAELALSPLMAATNTIELFNTVETDRLHMAILSAMIGREVTFRDNSYFKNRGVFERSLHAYDRVTMVPPNDLAATPPPPDVNYADRAKLLDRIDFLTGQLQNSRRRNMWLSSIKPPSAPLPLGSNDILASSFERSRGFRLWKAYIRLYEHPILGRPMKFARRLAARTKRLFVR